MITSKEIRQKFLEYFQDRGHTIVESSSLVPINDPTLLFTNAGMNQFKDVFLGVDKRPYNRATTAQKCVRAGGKHNDLDTVGRTARHHTFFEMMGNFSFGDYFKEDAIKFGWTFLTEVLGLPKEKLWITIYKDDDEAFHIWHDIVGVQEDRIKRLGEKDNFWAMGDTGPCGPCSEIHIDRGEEFACNHNPCALGECDCDRWLELWNLVFMQYNRDEDGNMTPLPRPSIDTGMGLERVTSVLQNVPSNYDTDLFVPIMQAIEKLTGKPYDRGEKGFPFRVIADHSRACTFLISDGVLPSNDGRGYVLRRILRRAVRFGTFLGLNEPFLYKNVDIVVELMGEAYPEIVEKKDFIKQVIKLEEEKFFVTLTEGNRKVAEMIENAKKEGRKVITGEEAFLLYDTYGFPMDLTEDIAEENHFTVDKDGFAEMMQQQRQRARSANKTGNAFAYEQQIAEILDKLPRTAFKGYEEKTLSSKVIALIKDGQSLESATDDEVLLVADQTPFYAESGGEVADDGIIKSHQSRMEVVDVQKVGPWFVHTVHIFGKITVGDEIEMEVAEDIRMDISRNHSATHLLHKALRTVLGEHAQQKGSLVEADRLRFDFSHLQALTEEELVRIEDMVNESIRADYPVNTEITNIDNAREMGAMALFGEKYGQEVRVVKMGDYSMELCGGCHVQRTGQIGAFKILSEGSVGSGLRRIEAVTGRKAVKYTRGMEKELQELAAMLKVNPTELKNRVETLQKTLRETEKELEKMKAVAAKAAETDLLVAAQEVSGFKVLVARFPESEAARLREAGEHLRDKMGEKSVALLAMVGEDKLSFVCFAGKEAVAKGVHAGKIVGAIAKVAGGGGGGRPDMAQAGGKDVSKLQDAMELSHKMIEEALK